MDDHMLPIRLLQVGDCRFSRYIIMDSIGQCFTGSGWSSVRSEAALYNRGVEAIGACNRFYVEGHPEDRFVAKVVVRAVQGDWTAADLAKHLRHWGRFIVQPSDEARGVIVEIDWDSLQKQDA